MKSPQKLFYAFKLLKNHRFFVISYLILFTFACSIFTSVQVLSDEFQSQIKLKSQNILQGDLRLRIRREFTEQEQKTIDSILPENTQRAKAWNFITMLRWNDRFQMIQIKATDQTYPLYGTFLFEDSTISKSAVPKGEMYLPLELKDLMDVKLGDTVQVGDVQFHVSKFYREAPDSHLDFNRMAYRVFTSLSDIQDTRLSQKGARIFRNEFYVLPPGNDIKEKKQQLLSLLDDPEIHVDATTDSKGQLNRNFHMMISFLKLISLLGILLAILGAIQFFQSYLSKELKSIAILNSLGLNYKSIIQIYLTQCLSLSTLAFLLSLPLTFLSADYFAAKIHEFYSVSLNFRLEPVTVSWLFVTIVSTTLFFSLKPIINTSNVSPFSLLKENFQFKMEKWTGLFYPLLFVWVFGLTFFNTRSWNMTFLFMGITFGGFLVSALFGWSAYRLAKWRNFRSYAFKIFLSKINAQPLKALSSFCILVIIILILNLIPQLKFILEKELSAEDDKSTLPTWFMVDIQEEQLQELETIIQEYQFEILQMAPTIRARLLSVNGQPFIKETEGKETLEDQQKKRMKNRGYNLSYRDSLSDSETIKEGLFWNNRFDDTSDTLPEISLEHKFADRVDLKMGDTLEFDIEGLPISGVVTSLRYVKWSGFQPNFFVLFQPGVLELAPKTFLSTVSAPPEIESQALLKFQKQMMDQYPNITLMDIRTLISKALALFDQFMYLISILSIFTLLCGLFILLITIISIINDNILENLLLEILGAKSSRLFGIIFFPTFLYCILAAVLGYVCSIIAVYLINEFMWELYIRIQYSQILYTTLCMFAFSIIVTIITQIIIKRNSPNQLLKSL